MTKKLALFMVLVLLITTCFSACSSAEDEEDDSSSSSSESDSDSVNADYYGFETNEDGEEVAVVYEQDEETGEWVAYVIDDNGEKTGEVIENPENAPDESSSSVDYEVNDDNENVTAAGTTAISVNKTESADATTSAQLDSTSSDSDDDADIPTLSSTGTKVQFSDSDIQILTYMLEVPYLYAANYDTGDAVPVSIASHVACWMAQESGSTANVFASGEVILNLFYYFAQTVAGYKANCNSDMSTNKAPITYNSSSDTFTITAQGDDCIEEQTHSVTISKVEDLGTSNYYKVTASVTEVNSSGCSKKKVVAIVQKNKLYSDLGFSVKALKWS